MLLTILYFSTNSRFTQRHRLCYDIPMNLPKEFVVEMNNLPELTDFDGFMASYDKAPVKSLRINPLKVPDPECILEDIGISPESDRIPWCETGFYYDDETAPGKHILHEAGAYYIQEASAMAPVEALDIKHGERILDLCAAPGGKSTQIAGHLMGSGILVSNEIIPKRAEILSENIERLGVPNALILCCEPAEIADRFPEFFDKVLVDAPCSGEGMFRKNPDAVKEWSPKAVENCADRQRDILDQAATTLKPGGRLVYSTCTFNRKENEGTIEDFLTGHPDWKLIKMQRFFPHAHRCEGHFAAVLEKSGEAIELSSPKMCEERRIETFGDNLYLLPESCPDLSGLKVVRAGLHLGAIKKGRFEPAHALAMSSVPGMLPVPFLEVSEDPAKSYIRGETFSAPKLPKGWYVICYRGISIGWGKCAAGIMKNHYPKGLRKIL